MKIIEPRPLLPEINEDEVLERIDLNMRYTEVTCPRCGRGVRFTEGYITRYMKNEVERVIKIFKDGIRETYEASLSVYGEDARLIKLAEKLLEIQKKANRAHLKIVTKKGDGENAGENARD